MQEKAWTLGWEKYTRLQLTILLCKSAGLHKGDLSVRLQVSLVTHHHYDDIGAGQSPGVCQPVCQCIVCLTAGEEMEKQVRRERGDWEREDSEEKRKDKEVKERWDKKREEK